MTGAEQAREYEERLRRVFNDPALERLARSEHEYYSTHGEYVPGLARLLLIERGRLSAVEAALRETREVLREDADKYPALLATLDQHGPPNAGRVFNRLLAALARSGEQT